jgi:hypothetical protein
LDACDSGGIHGRFRRFVRDQLHACHKALPAAHIADDIVGLRKFQAALVELFAARRCIGFQIEPDGFGKASGHSRGANGMGRISVAVVDAALGRVALFKDVGDLFAHERGADGEVA